MLNGIPGLRGNDGGVSACYIILRKLTLVDFAFFGAKIYREFLLQACITFIFFISQYAYYGFVIPSILAAGRWYMHIRQELSNMAGCVILKRQHIYEPNHTSLIFVYYKFSFFGTTVIAEKVCKRNGIKAVANCFRLPQVTLSEMDLLSSSANELISVSINSPLESRVLISSF